MVLSFYIHLGQISHLKLRLLGFFYDSQEEIKKKKNQGAILPIVEDYFKIDRKNGFLGVSFCDTQHTDDLVGLQLLGS